MTLPVSLILASASPRRKELLAGLGLDFRQVVSDVDETPLPGELPKPQCLRLANEKARAVAARYPEALTLGADTSVVIDEHILGKPADEADAQRMLAMISGRWHTVVTAFALHWPEKNIETERVVTSEVFIRELSDAQIRWYIQTGEPMDKAGSYAIQGLGAALVSQVQGSYTCVVGLPLTETVEAFEALFGPDCLFGNHRKRS